jgi:hypothetical protein
MGAVVQGRPALRASTRASSADALGHYLSIGLDVLPRAYRGANALSEDDGAYWWILAAQDAAGRNLHGWAGGPSRDDALS